MGILKRWGEGRACIKRGMTRQRSKISRISFQDLKNRERSGRRWPKKTEKGAWRARPKKIMAKIQQYRFEISVNVFLDMANMVQLYSL